MLPFLAVALAAADLLHPSLTFTRAPVLERSVTIVEVAPLPNARNERAYLFRRTFRHGGESDISWADSRTCPGAIWVVEEAVKVPPPRVRVPGVEDPAAPDVITLTADGVAYGMSSGARYGSSFSGTIRFTSNVGTPLAAWVEESLRRLQPCWSSRPPQV
jgi:hypothetical protein